MGRSRSSSQGKKTARKRAATACDYFSLSDDSKSRAYRPSNSNRSGPAPSEEVGCKKKTSEMSQQSQRSVASAPPPGPSSVELGRSSPTLSFVALTRKETAPQKLFSIDHHHHLSSQMLFGNLLTRTKTLIEVPGESDPYVSASSTLSSPFLPSFFCLELARARAILSAAPLNSWEARILLLRQLLADLGSRARPQRGGQKCSTLKLTPVPAFHLFLDQRRHHSSSSS